MPTALHLLRAKLCRELAQSEQSAMVHALREARRLGDVPPARALRLIAAHATQLRPRLEELTRTPPVGVRLGRSVGAAFSVLQHAVFGVVDSERSYRQALLGLRHGVDLTRLLREVALRETDAALVHLCDEFLVERIGLIEQAEQALAWFAEEPERALGSGARIALEPATR